MALRRILGVTLALLPLFSIGACVSQSGKTSQQAAVPALTQPGLATYNCADGGMMTIENAGSSIRLLGPDGVMEELPASPPGQQNRYGAEHDAILLNGKDALVMKSGRMPLDCTR